MHRALRNKKGGTWPPIAYSNEFMNQRLRGTARAPNDDAYGAVTGMRLRRRPLVTSTMPLIWRPAGLSPPWKRIALK
jgi:hypothetical protein